ncbi:hypothetical protein LSAJ112_140106 [Latilactobacillus sakei]|nr:hypothetical protein LSAJ112_140106 [Latilactobacillus sakei]
MMGLFSCYCLPVSRLSATELAKLDLKIYGGSMMTSLIVTLLSLSTAGMLSLIEKRNKKADSARDTDDQVN